MGGDEFPNKEDAWMVKSVARSHVTSLKQQVITSAPTYAAFYWSIYLPSQIILITLEKVEK
jgi:hypothetical protein